MESRTKDDSNEARKAGEGGGKKIKKRESGGMVGAKL